MAVPESAPMSAKLDAETSLVSASLAALSDEMILSKLLMTSKIQTK